MEATGCTDLLPLLTSGPVPALLISIEGQPRTAGPQPALLFPGSFNPLHSGHWGLASAASSRTGKPVTFELCVLNVDKPVLPADEVRRRLAQFTGRAALWVTRAPTFAEKATLFPGTVFVIGSDTAARVIAPRYYADSAQRMSEALDHIRDRGCRFLVAGRVDAAGRFVGADDLDLPPRYRDLFEAIPESEFRHDRSSTELRNCSPPSGQASH